MGAGAVACWSSAFSTRGELESPGTAAANSLYSTGPTSRDHRYLLTISISTIASSSSSSSSTITITVTSSFHFFFFFVFFTPYQLSLSLSLSYSFSSQYCRDVPFVFLLLRCVLHSGSCAPLLHSPTESTFRRVIRSTILSIECRRIPPSIKSSRDSVDHNDSFTRRDSNFSIVRLIQRNERKPRIGEIFGLANFHRVGKGWTMDFVVLFELKRMDIREKSRNVEGNLDR